MLPTPQASHRWHVQSFGAPALVRVPDRRTAHRRHHVVHRSHHIATNPATVSAPPISRQRAGVVLGAWVIDHPRVLQSVDGIRITLDKIEQHALSDPEAMRRELSQRLGVDVLDLGLVPGKPFETGPMLESDIEGLQPGRAL